MVTGRGRGAGRGMGRDAQSMGQGGFNFFSLGLGLLSDLISRTQNVRERHKDSDTSKAGRLVAAVNMDKCCFCGICREICPQGAICQGKVLRIDTNRCTGCGQCVMQCPEEALVLKKG